MMYPPDLRACAGAVDLCVHLPHPCLGSSVSTRRKRHRVRQGDAQHVSASALGLAQARRIGLRSDAPLSMAEILQSKLEDDMRRTQGSGRWGLGSWLDCMMIRYTLTDGSW
jgi:hypothetical protein